MPDICFQASLSVYLLWCVGFPFAQLLLGKFGLFRLNHKRTWVFNFRHVCIRHELFQLSTYLSEFLAALSFSICFLHVATSLRPTQISSPFRQEVLNAYLQAQIDESNTLTFLIINNITWMKIWADCSVMMEQSYK